MAVPVISPIVSISSYARGEYFDFQPVATGTPTGWSATLPAGLEIDEDTGLVSGSLVDQGIYDLAIIATNGDGDSAPLIFPVRIRPSSSVAGCSLELDIDVETGAVSRPLAGASDALVVRAKHGDTLLVSVGFVKAGVLLSAPLVTLIRFGVKEFEGDQLLSLSSGLVRVLGAYASRRYLIAVEFERAELLTMLSGYESDRAASFSAIAEMEWTFFETVIEGADPVKQIRSTQSFALQLDRDLLTNLADE